MALNIICQVERSVLVGMRVVVLPWGGRKVDGL